MRRLCWRRVGSRWQFGASHRRVWVGSGFSGCGGDGGGDGGSKIRWRTGGGDDDGMDSDRERGIWEGRSMELRRGMN